MEPIRATANSLAKCPVASQDWQTVAFKMGISDNKIQQIQNKYGDGDWCVLWIQILEAWSSVRSSEATKDALVRMLQSMGHNRAACLVEETPSGGGEVEGLLPTPSFGSIHSSNEHNITERARQLLKAKNTRSCLKVLGVLALLLGFCGALIYLNRPDTKTPDKDDTTPRLPTSDTPTRMPHFCLKTWKQHPDSLPLDLVNPLSEDRVYKALNSFTGIKLIMNIDRLCRCRGRTEELGPVESNSVTHLDIINSTKCRIDLWSFTPVFTSLEHVRIVSSNLDSLNFKALWQLLSYSFGTLKALDVINSTYGTEIKQLGSLNIDVCISECGSISI